VKSPSNPKWQEALEAHNKYMKEKFGREENTDHTDPHLYIAAYSVSDAVRLITEFCGCEGRGVKAEITNYFSPDCWGNAMEGITPERGLWIKFGHTGTPVTRLI